VQGVSRVGSEQPPAQNAGSLAPLPTSAFEPVAHRSGCSERRPDRSRPGPQDDGSWPGPVGETRPVSRLGVSVEPGRQARSVSPRPGRPRRPGTHGAPAVGRSVLPGDGDTACSPSRQRRTGVRSSAAKSRSGRSNSLRSAAPRTERPTGMLRGDQVRHVSPQSGATTAGSHDLGHVGAAKRDPSSRPGAPHHVDVRRDRRVRSHYSACPSPVKGHQDLRAGGHENRAVMVMRTAR